MGRADFGNSKQHLIPTYQPKGAEGEYKSARKKNSTVAGDSVKRSGQTVQNKNQHKRPQKGQVLTQHTGLPPRETGEKDHLVVKVNQNQKLVDNDKKALFKSLFNLK